MASKAHSPTRTVTEFDAKASQVIEAKNQRLQQILENDEKMRVYHHNKLEKSSPVFANTKVTSCSSVLMSNGLSVAIPFRSGSNFRGHANKEKLVSMTQ